MTLLDFLPYISTAAAAVFGWFTGRRKTKADANASELDNVEKALGIYRSLVEDLKKEIAALRTELAAVASQNTQLLFENRQLKQQLEGLELKLQTLSVN